MEFLPILMTASVSTHGMKGACFSDEERYAMYLNSLTHYISISYKQCGGGGKISLC